MTFCGKDIDSVCILSALVGVLSSQMPVGCGRLLSPSSPQHVNMA